MNHPTILFSDGPECPEPPLSGSLPPPSEAASPAEQPDARLFLREGDRVTAYAALWWRHTPTFEGNPVGAIGGFAAENGEAARRLLDAASDRLRAEGSRRAVGPMNGNTWRRYRFIVESQGRAPFLLEPRQPEPFPRWWQAAGFSALAQYSSSSVPLDGQTTVPGAIHLRLERNGVTIRALDPDRYDDELRAIYAINLASFSQNFLYTPLPEDDFLTAYQKLRHTVDPEFVRIAERDGTPCGFVFAIADLEAAARREAPALILKTLAVDPQARVPGLGSVLVDQVQRMGYEKGFREALHVLQYDDNTVRRITGRHQGQIFRRYALFSKPL